MRRPDFNSFPMQPLPDHHNESLSSMAPSTHAEATGRETGNMGCFQIARSALGRVISRCLPTSTLARAAVGRFPGAAYSAVSAADSPPLGRSQRQLASAGPDAQVPAVPQRVITAEAGAQTSGPPWLEIHHSLLRYHEYREQCSNKTLAIDQLTQSLDALAPETSQVVREWIDREKAADRISGVGNIYPDNAGGHALRDEDLRHIRRSVTALQRALHILQHEPLAIGELLRTRDECIKKFADLSPNKKQVEYFEDLMDRMAEAQDNATFWHWHVAADRLLRRMDEARSMTSQVDEDRRTARDDTVLREIRTKHWMLEQHHEEHLTRITEAHDLAHAATENSIGGALAAREHLLRAQTLKADLLTQYSLGLPTKRFSHDAAASQLVRHLPEQHYNGIPHSSLVSFGEFLATAEPVASREDLLSILQYTQNVYLHQSARCRSALDAMMSTRLMVRLRLQGMPPQEAKHLARLIRREGTADFADLVAVAQALGGRDPDVLRVLARRGLQVKVCRQNITQVWPERIGKTFSPESNQPSSQTLSTPITFWEDQVLSGAVTKALPILVVAVTTPDAAVADTADASSVDGAPLAPLAPSGAPVIQVPEGLQAAFEAAINALID
ncbi:hypothetical protein SAMN05216359_105215 [Roseateles sp. YR242]|uniref:hypothetical protein n=1 Tax=Roseateles sp. YR242 TaxID=1855305 RepID=UPI0008C45784|nr:hypothetical protein [Roseateles sp. YR242]SEL10876.1 hypothetical protein SAMN05216359_105215 [Roseateles sp. YR242]